jgi:hypothetical protein
MQRAALATGLILLSSAVPAATFCVGSSAALSAALTTASSNNEDDEIRIAAGTYYVGASTSFRADIGEAHGLKIRGGYALLTACKAANGDASLTILDGGGIKPVLSIRVFTEYQVVPIAVTGLTLRNGLHQGSSDQGWSGASGLSIEGFYRSAPAILVDRVIVHNNVSTIENTPAVRLTGANHFVRFSNSVVRHNATVSAPVFIHSNFGGSALTNLSVAYNARAGSWGSASIEWFGTAPGQIVQSVIFGNTGGSVEFSPGGGIQCMQVRIGGGDCIFNGSPDPYAIIADPQFETTTNLRPRVGSPLHNRVYDSVDALDVYGQPRNRGGLVDIGAVEARESS